MAVSVGKQTKEKPILFSTEMVKAILEGRKIMTRRVIPQKKLDEIKSIEQITTFAPNLRKEWAHECLPYEIGMRLWVRESFCADCTDGGIPCYKANREHQPASDFCHENDKGWHPSIFMPREASRITLEITGLKVERVQDISEEDAVAEGVQSFNGGSYTVPARGQFATLWHNLNAKRGYGWSQNPYVWVISFKRVQNGR